MYIQYTCIYSYVYRYIKGGINSAFNEVRQPSVQYLCPVIKCVVAYQYMSQLQPGYSYFMWLHSIYLMGYWHILQCFITRKKGLCDLTQCVHRAMTHTVRGVRHVDMLCMDLWQTVLMKQWNWIPAEWLCQGLGSGRLCCDDWNFLCWRWAASWTVQIKRPEVWQR